jgi:hypothetical protein
MSFGKFHQVTTDDQLHAEIQAVEEEELQEQVNMLKSTYSEVKCRHGGVGSDGKLKCKWLADNGTCLFKHSDTDLILKGKGVSKDFTKSTPTHTRKVQMVTESTHSSSDEENL